MILSAILKLDAGAFTTPLGKAVEGIKGAIRIAGELNDRLTEAFDLGGALSDLQAQTGELPGTLMLLRQAFQDTGVGAEALGQTLAIMRKAMGGISETGEPTSKIFKQLGIDLDTLQRSDASTQLQTIGQAISSLSTPAEQTAAAMAIFGRSGARMLTLLKDREALAAAAKSLGELPALMNRNAQAFDAVSDRMERIKGKGMGLWAGIAEGLLPLADQITATMDGIDLTGIGQKIGNHIGAMVKMFQDAPLGQTIEDLLTVGLSNAVNFAATAFDKLGLALLEAMKGPLATLSAEFGVMIQGAMEGLGKLPGFLKKYPVFSVSPILSGLADVAKSDALRGFQAQSFQEQRDQALANYENTLNGIRKNTPSGMINLLDSSEAANRLKTNFRASFSDYLKEIKNVQGSATIGKIEGLDLTNLQQIKPLGDSKPIDTDALTRIGLYTGSSTQSRMTALNERTARGVERLVSLLETQRPRQAAWGV